MLALLFGALLLAPGMHKAAFNGQPGTKRDVALALTGGLNHVSHALFLDRPRQLVQDAMGRDHADEINVAIVAPPPTEPTPATTTTPTATTPVKKPAAKPKPPAKIAFSPKKKMRIWVAGDSLVITPGYAIVRAAGGSPAIESVGGVDGHVATGLTRPDVFNWFQEIATKVKELKPNVVVLNFGGNDNHGYMTGLPQGVSIGDFAGPSWSKEYLRRLRIVMDTINRAGATVVWIGLPIVSSPTVTDAFDKINAIVVKEAKRRGPKKAIYIDTYTMFAGRQRRLHRVPRGREGRPGQGAGRRRRPLRHRRRRHDRARGVATAEQGLRPDELAPQGRRAHDRLRRPPPGRQRRRPEQPLDAEAARGARRAIGLEDVSTVLQSGNVLFASSKSEAAVTKLVQETMAESSGSTARCSSARRRS